MSTVNPHMMRQPHHGQHVESGEIVDVFDRMQEEDEEDEELG